MLGDMRVWSLEGHSPMRSLPSIFKQVIELVTEILIVKFQCNPLLRQLYSWWHRCLCNISEIVGNMRGMLV